MASPTPPRDPPAPARLVLVGLMGSGKSTVGRRVAAALGWPYLDNDDELTAATGRTLAALSEDGAEALHAAERAVLADILRREPPLVASAAAAVVTDAATRALLHARAYAVYLHVPADELARRVGDDPYRPWLRPDPLAALRGFHAARDPLYRAVARLVVDGTATPDEAARAVVAGLPRRPGPAGRDPDGGP